MKRLLETLRQDIGYASRSARLNPGYVIAATATLALGIGAVTAIFSILSGVLLRPLPYSHPEGLVEIGQSPSDVGLGYTYLRDLEVWWTRSTQFAEFAHYLNTSRNLYGLGEP